MKNGEALEWSVEKPGNPRAIPANRLLNCRQRRMPRTNWLIAATRTTQRSLYTHRIPVNNADQKEKGTSYDAPSIPCSRMGHAVDTPVSQIAPVHHPNSWWGTKVAGDYVRCIRKNCTIETTIDGTWTRQSLSCWHWTSSCWLHGRATKLWKRRDRTERQNSGFYNINRYVQHQWKRTRTRSPE